MKYLQVILFLALISCSRDPAKLKEKPPVNRDTFVKVLADIHTVDALSNMHTFFRTYPSKDSVDLYSPIFEKYNITKADFDSTVAIYTRRPGVYLDVYDEVIQELNYRTDTLLKNDLKFNTEKADLENRSPQ